MKGEFVHQLFSPGDLFSLMFNFQNCVFFPLKYKSICSIKIPQHWFFGVSYFGGFVAHLLQRWVLTTGTLPSWGGSGVGSLGEGSSHGYQRGVLRCLCTVCMLASHAAVVRCRISSRACLSFVGKKQPLASLGGWPQVEPSRCPVIMGCAGGQPWERKAQFGRRGWTVTES